VSDARIRQLKRQWGSYRDPAVGQALFWELVRSLKWSAAEYPDLFWLMIDTPRETERAIAAMVQASRDRAWWPDNYWELNPHSYKFLRAYRMGYYGRVEADGSRFHVTASLWGGRRPVLISLSRWGEYRSWRSAQDEATYHGAVLVPGSDPPLVLASVKGPSLKRFAGKPLKGRSPSVLYPANYRTVRIMEANTKRGRTRWKNNPTPEERIRQLERQWAETTDVHVAHELLRWYDRAGMEQPALLLRAALRLRSYQLFRDQPVHDELIQPVVELTRSVGR
jgi:hypothetical protein